MTSFCPTIVSSSPATYAASTRVFADLTRQTARRHAEALAGEPHTAPDGAPGARVLGLHLEGPFIALERRGAHAPEHLQTPRDGAASLDSVYGPHADWEGGGVRIVTLAPELPGALEAVRALAARGVVASIGHT